MSLIIAATDFTEAGNNAVQYACRLATTQNAEVVIFHAYVVPVSFDEMPIQVMPIEDAKNIAEDNMDSIIKEMKSQFPDTEITDKIGYGDIIDNLEEYSTGSAQPWLIVVGNSNTGTSANWLDSNMIQAFHKLKCPVLAIPPNVVYKSINRICFAYDNVYIGAENAITQLEDIVTSINAELHIVYTSPDVMNRDNIPDIESNIKTLLKRLTPKYHIIFDAIIESEIPNFIAAHRIDWLIVMPRHHSFFENIFHRSHTKAIAHSINIPLVALHSQ